MLILPHLKNKSKKLYPKNMAKVIVGMSGGVDSSVSASLLKKQGYDVEGVSFVLYEARLKHLYAGCCSLESINDARKTSENIGIKHRVVDLRNEFMEKVIEPFIDAYSKGLTPNPCILCNKHIKFPYLLQIANDLDADFFATGHYAQVVRTEGQKDRYNLQSVLLKKGIDTKKDQSYVLYALKKEEINRLKLPLGEKKKDEVREIAKKLNLSSANRPESQEICFIEDRNYSRFLAGFLDGLTGNKEGKIFDIKTGDVLGTHKGIYLYTIGQRKRLGIAAKAPMYVVKIDPALNAVYVGPKEAAMIKEFWINELNWLVNLKTLKQSEHNSDKLTCASSEFRDYQTSGLFGFRVSVKIRSTMKDEPATITLMSEDIAKIIFNESQWAPAPGQSAVFYDGDTVVGGGIIQNSQF